MKPSNKASKTSKTPAKKKPAKKKPARKKPARKKPARKKPARKKPVKKKPAEGKFASPSSAAETRNQGDVNAALARAKRGPDMVLMVSSPRGEEMDFVEFAESLEDQVNNCKTPEQAMEHARRAIEGITRLLVINVLD